MKFKDYGVPEVVLTEEEVQKIRKAYSRTLKRKTKLTKSMSVSASHCFAEGKPFTETIQKIQEYAAQLAEKSDSSIENVYIKRNNSYYASSNTMLFYIVKEESEQEFNIRLEHHLKKKIEAANRDKRRRLVAEAKEKERKKAILLNAIEELGPEIYDIFEEIKLKEPKKDGSNPNKTRM